MTAPARLLALRVQGFKSFAERTVVEFGPGISAVVGPNGSGKSNLADALRWALGEQGRALRSRKGEDVIFAGSERRAALGMADVTLVLDNADGLLPVEYSALELGRRLYRSGENDYLLNRQRVRLRDLIDLLDAAHLADNAFLFIGQGMVDQALALRPEERRPLFEEVAGVRRHERRRRKAEEQLAEAEANLARVDDIVGELRPQARRLAAQAEQQVTRASAGDELAAALVVAAHARWHEASSRHREAAGRLARARGEAERAMTALSEAEAAAAAVSSALGDRAEAERDRRAAHEAARAALTDLQLREARLTQDLAAIGRDRSRLDGERRAAEADLAVRRREAAAPLPGRPTELDAALADAERTLADGLGELGALRAASQARGEELAALRRAEAARMAEAETARRRLAEAERRAVEERGRADGTASVRVELDDRLVAARSAALAAVEAEQAAIAAREAARAAVDEAEGVRRAAAERATAAGTRLAAVRGRVETARARLAEDETRGIARAARRAGGRRVDDELQVEPTFRAAVEAALGELARAFALGREAIPGLASERGTLVPADGPSAALVRAGAGPTTRALPSTDDRAVRDALDRLGGGVLAQAVRRDPVGVAGRFLGTCAWVPDLATLVELQPFLPPGWIAVTRDGAAVATTVAIALGRAEGPLERRAELDRLDGVLAALVGEAAEAERIAGFAVAEAGRTRATLERARQEESRVAADRRAAEEAERVSGRAAENAVREAGWHAAQAERAESELRRSRETLDALEERPAARPSTSAGRSPRSTSRPDDGAAAGPEATALETWEERVAELRSRRDRLAAQLAESERARRESEGVIARAAAATAYGEERIARAETDLRTITERERAHLADRDGLAVEVAAAVSREADARSVLDELHTADRADRERLVAAEAAAATARDRLRGTDDRVRSAEVADLEARLALDAIREQALVELAGIGAVGLRALRAASGAAREGAEMEDADPGPVGDVGDAAADESETAAFEAVLPALLPIWEAGPPATEPPTSGRLATLRRRFHELGASNPYAVDEYAELKARLETLEAQAADLRSAITRTRALIEELSTLIADQFRTTFAALETAFDTRFKQLFDGGFARLELTDPADLSATGVEIVARPPGKKAQALAMLSGGERALTAVALLFAMLEVRPVPFCVLDEVDAALDEANVGRFADALRSLADATQFIVITHNRGTIEAADALYGVTVGDDSVSRVISLRLDEATAIAEGSGSDGVGALDAVGG